MSTYINWDANGIQTTAGDDSVIAFQVKDEASNNVDITGWTFALYGQNQADSDDTFEVTNSSFTVTDAAEGQAKVVVGRSITLAYAITGADFRDAIWRTNSGAQRELCSGPHRINPTIRP